MAHTMVPTGTVALLGLDNVSWFPDTGCSSIQRDDEVMGTIEGMWRMSGQKLRRIRPARLDRRAYPGRQLLEKLREVVRAKHPATGAMNSAVDAADSYRSFITDLQKNWIQAGLSDENAVRTQQTRAVTELLVQTYQKLLSHLQPNLILEIGAFEASFSRQAKRRHPAARVVAFEANKLVYDQFAPKVKASNVEYLHRCVSDRIGQVTIRVPRRSADGSLRNTMGSLLTLTRGGPDYEEQEVESTTVDRFLSQQGPTSHAKCAMWVDVEGAAASVLSGAELTLPSCDAVMIEVESDQRWEGQRIDLDVFAYLQRFGLVPVLRDLQRPWQYNVICLRTATLSDGKISAICSQYLNALASSAGQSNAAT